MFHMFSQVLSDRHPLCCQAHRFLLSGPSTRMVRARAASGVPPYPSLPLRFRPCQAKRNGSGANSNLYRQWYYFPEKEHHKDQRWWLLKCVSAGIPGVVGGGQTLHPTPYTLPEHPPCASARDGSRAIPLCAWIHLHTAAPFRLEIAMTGQIAKRSKPISSRGFYPRGATR